MSDVRRKSLGGNVSSRNKLKKGKRDGTPEKATTPSQDALPEETAAEKRPVIMNDEIRALEIKADTLDKMREPKPPLDRKKTPMARPVVVRKLKPASEWDKPVPKIVTVAKPAPPDAPLHPIDYANAAGLRFDKDGNIIAHSILGSVDDFKREAIRRGDLSADMLEDSVADANDELTVKYEKKKKLSQFPKFESVEESNALRNWQKRMMERRKQQNHLSKMLSKAPDKLVMNQADSFRKTQEHRYVIDRTIATMDYGKGYRIGSEFWKQQERVGDDLTGLHMTLSQTEKGYPPPIEHVGVPRTVLNEKGANWSRPSSGYSKPWHHAPYLHQRTAQLQPVINELDPYKPDLASLEVVGSNQPRTRSAATISPPGTTDYEDIKQEFLEREKDAENFDPLSDHPDVYPEPVFGPSLKFAGQSARWTGDSTAFCDQAGLEARVSFEAYAADRVTSFLEIVNDGTTSIYYNWKKVPKVDPFEMMAAKVQRFYFNTSSGVILPGDTMKFPFVFKSPNAGVFSEQWCFETTPAVCGGASLVVTLRGVSLQKDKFKKQRTELEQELAHKQAEQVVIGILNSLIDGIRSPERPRSAIDAYITEEEIFQRKNPMLHYSNQTVSQVKELFKEVYPLTEEGQEEANTPTEDEKQEDKETAEDGEPVPREIPEWDLSIANLKEQIMCLDEDDPSKQDFLQRLNTAMISLSFPPFAPRQQQMYSMGYQLMSEMVDGLAGESMMLRATMGLPEREGDEYPDEPKSASGRKESRASGRASGVTRPTSNSADTSTGAGRVKTTRPGLTRSPTRTELKTPASRESRKKGAKDAKPDAKDRKTPAKDAKTSQKASAKETNRGGGKGTATFKGSASKEKERPSSGMSGTVSPVQDGDPVLDAKYKEKFYTNAYLLICDTVDKMSCVFGEIEGNSKLSAL